MPAQKLAPQLVKILFIDHTPFVGGAQICLARDIEYLDRNKFQPFLLISKNSKFDFIYKRSKVKIYRISFDQLKRIHPAVLPELFKSLKEFTALLEKIKPDLVVTNTTRGLILAGLVKDYKLSLKVLRRKETPKFDFKLICRIWDYGYPNWLLKSLGLSVDKFLVVSKSVAGYYKLQKPKAETVYLASDIHQQIKGPKLKSKAQRLKKELGIVKGDFVIGFAGRLVEWKGPLYLLNAFRKINDPHLKLIYFGTGKGQEDDVEERLKREIRNKRLEDRIVMAGFVEDSSLIYSMINCFVQSSIESEPFATNMVEAALSKVPIIATHIGGTPEFIKSGKNGLLVKPKDTNQLAQALLRLSRDKKLAKKLANNAYKDAQKFKEEIFIKKLEKIYESSARS